MQLFRKSSSSKLEPAWTYGVKGVIWRIHPTAGGTLAGEERWIDEKKTFFFCLDRRNGQELWRQASPGDEWWVGIEAVYRDTVFFHGFATPNLPLHRGIIAADVLTGKKLWEDHELEFVGTRDDLVIGSKETSTGRSYLELDRRSGARRRELSAADLDALYVNRSGVDVELTLPAPVEQLATLYPQLESAIRSHPGSGTLAGPVEVAEHGEFLIIDYYEATRAGTAGEGLYSGAIKVVERNTGTVAYSDTVLTGTKAVVPELFFVQHDTLYYIKERRTLTAVRLAS